MTDAAIDVRDLRLMIPNAGHARPVLDGLDLTVAPGTTLGVIGESGSGKSVLSRALLGEFPPGADVRGSITVLGTDVVRARPAAIESLRRRRVSMVFQDPRASVNTVYPISDFLTEQVVRAGVLNRSDARSRAIELLDRMRIREPHEVIDRYPSELSGGMLQRVVLAAALMPEPELLICDEATTALDVTTQAEIVQILRSLGQETGMTLVFVTHDLELAGDLCDSVFVLYSGRSMELGATASLLEEPRHPYTAALLRSTPRLGDRPGMRLPSIPGSVLSLGRSAEGCVFADRCGLAVDACTGHSIPMVKTSSGQARCIRIDAHDGDAA
jgi:oligopeptide/dipeptide ABC transporter ATP-binding protein